MSHAKERKEKICLNCNTDLNGRFCHVCGQENIEPKTSAWGLITHFFNDITHFDGKFFSTTGLLITRPGLLPKEYMLGRRARYLNPIRQYIFTSAIFFLIFFSIFTVNPSNFTDEAKETKTAATLDAARAELVKNSANAEDSLFIEQQFSRVGQRLGIAQSDSASKGDSTVKKKRPPKRYWQFNLTDKDFSTREEYDSVQRALPESERDGWLERKSAYRSIELNKRMEEDPNQFWKDLLTSFVHTFPYLLFVSLPLYALFLKLLYVRRRKFFYVDHAMFLIYLYIFTFIFLLVFFAIDELSDATGWDWLDWIILGLFFWGIYYAWRAMHKFYGQGRFKTFVKFLLFNFLCLISIVLLFALFFVFIVFSI